MSPSFSYIFDLASQRAFVTGEWYIPGHKLIGFRIEEPASIGCELSYGEVVETAGIDSEESGSAGSAESNGLERDGSEFAVDNGLFGISLYKIGPYLVALETDFSCFGDLGEWVSIT